MYSHDIKSDAGKKRNILEFIKDTIIIIFKPSKHLKEFIKL